jgi:hypothetical protein
MTDYLSVDKDFTQLALRDLIEARDQYHVQLMHKKNVVATALGRYRIRKSDPWPSRHHPRPAGKSAKAKGARTIENSEVRPYSWPCVLVFVEHWLEPDQFHVDGKNHKRGKKSNPNRATFNDLVPSSLYLSDGRVIPVCVVEAPRYLPVEDAPADLLFPANNIGGGYPVLAQVQGREYVASIGCLVTDGHKTYAITNRHVCGEHGEVLYSRLDGKPVPIGTSAAKHLTRLPFEKVYTNWPGKNVYVNLDIGLLDITDLEAWSAEIREFGQMGPLADLSIYNISLRLIGCPVMAYGAASGKVFGEIHGLFYRYKSVGGFDYVADFLIGQRLAASSPVKRAGKRRGKRRPASPPPPFATRPGDSGTVWLMESPKERNGTDAPPMPIAVQWGAHVFTGSDNKPATSFALATCLSTVCNLLAVDPVRDWNLDQPDTWGAVGHYSIAAATAKAISDASPNLQELMTNNRTIISYKDEVLATDDFKGQTMADFVPLADVPDNVWKHGRQGFSRSHEGPNHFADMDQKRADGNDLLGLCESNAANIDPKVWDDFYESVTDPLSGKRISYEHRGLLPFRVKQIFEAMVGFVRNEQFDEFVCAAGVLAHYVGDACQPLHISYLHHGDPEDTITKMMTDRHTHEKKPTAVPRAEGVHEMYETTMVGNKKNRALILKGLAKTPKVKTSELIQSGQEAAEATVELMQKTFATIAPMDIVQAFNAGKDGEASVPAAFWSKFGDRTITVMRGGAHLLAVLWESAWTLGNGEQNVQNLDSIGEKRAKKIYQDRDFIPSYYINEIAKPPGPTGGTARTSGNGSPSRSRRNGRSPRPTRTLATHR